MRDSRCRFPTNRCRAGTPTTTPPPTTIANVGDTIEILADGTGVVRDAAGKEITRIPGMAAKVEGQWLIRAKHAEWLKGAKIIKVAKCIGIIGIMEIISQGVAMGADGVLMGTRFLATREAPVPPSITVIE